MSTSKSYMESLGEISSSMKGAHHAANIIKAMMPPARIEGDAVTATAPVAKTTESVSVGKSILGLAPGLVGGGAGALFYKSHRVIGFLGGHAVASNAMPILRGSASERKSAMCRLGIEGAGVVGALFYKKHSVLGWLAGVVAGTVATSMIPNSPVRAELQKIKEKL